MQDNKWSIGSKMFKERLKVSREEKGLSQEALGSSLDISAGTIKRYEAGKGYPDIDKFQNMCSVLGVSVEWLLNGEGPMRPGERATTEISVPPLKDKLRRLASMPGKADEKLGRYHTPEEEAAIQELSARYDLPPDKLARIIDDLSSVGVGEDFVLIPERGVAASAGHGAQNHDERVVDRIAFKLPWIKNELRVPPRNLVVVRARGDSMEPTIQEGDILLVDGGAEHLKDGGIYVINRGDDLLVKRIQTTADGWMLTSDNPHYAPQELKKTDISSVFVIGRVVWRGGRKI